MKAKVIDKISAEILELSYGSEQEADIDVLRDNLSEIHESVASLRSELGLDNKIQIIGYVTPQATLVAAAYSLNEVGDDTD